MVLDQNNEKCRWNQFWRHLSHVDIWKIVGDHNICSIIDRVHDVDIQHYLEVRFVHSRATHFVNVAIISPWKNEWPLIWTNLNSLYPRILCVMFGWNWPSGSGIDFQKLSICFLNFCYYHPLEKRQGPTFERNWIPLTQGCSVPSLVESGPVVLEN